MTSRSRSLGIEVGEENKLLDMSRFNAWFQRHPVAFGVFIAAIAAAPGVIGFLVKGHWAANPSLMIGTPVAVGLACGYSAWRGRPDPN